LPSCSSLQWSIPRSRTDAGLLRGVGLVRLGALTRTVCAAHLLLLTVIVIVSGAETHWSGRAFVYGALRAALGFRSTLRWRTSAPRRRIGAEVPASVGAHIRRDL